VSEIRCPPTLCAGVPAILLGWTMLGGAFTLTQARHDGELLHSPFMVGSETQRQLGVRSQLPPRSAEHRMRRGFSKTHRVPIQTLRTEEVARFDTDDRPESRPAIDRVDGR